MQKIIFTDLDGTLTLKDTYTKFLLRNITLNNLIVNCHTLIKTFSLHLFKRINDDDVKNATFKIFFQNKDINELRNDIDNFINTIPWNTKVISLIKEEQKKGCKVIIVTASPDVYVQYICNHLGYDDYISTETEQNNSILTGSFNGKICNFNEKVKKIKGYLKDRQFYKIAYGNSEGDHAMLRYCDESYFVKKLNIKKFT